MPQQMPPPGLAPGVWDAADINQRISIMRWIYPLGNFSIREVIVDYARQHYGALAAYLDDAEIGPILERAAQGGWSSQRINAAIEQTTYWKNTTEAQRQYDSLVRQDPASAANAVTKAEAAIRQLLSQQGVIDQYADARITELATTIVRNGAKEDEIPRMVLADSQYSPTRPVGQLGQIMAQVIQRSNDYLVPMGEQDAFDWAKQVAMGTQTMEGVDTYMRELAKGRWATLADDIDRGSTPKQIFAPYVQQTADLLETSADQIDLLDPRFASMVDFTDGQGVHRPMSLSEAGQHVRGSEDYAFTQRANAEAARFGEQLLQKFGLVA